MANDKPEPGKVYSLYDLSRKGSWKAAEISRDGLKVGQVVAYSDMANPYQEAVVVEPEGMLGQKCVFLGDGHTSSVSASMVRRDGHAGWQYVDRIMTVEEIEVALELGRVAQATKKQEQEAAAIARQKEIDELPAKHPHLECHKTSKYAGVVLAARNIRTELKAEFPKVKFSVKSKSYSGGDSISVSWTDGPTTEQVKQITSKYEFGSFDGMTDSYDYNYSTWTDVFGGTKYVFENRAFSQKLFNKAVLAIAEEYGIANMPTWEEYQNGNAYGSPMGGDPTHYWNWQSLINRTAGEIAL